MRVWIVLCYYFDDTSIEAVFSTEEKAREKMKELTNKNLNYRSYDIEDYEVEA